MTFAKSGSWKNYITEVTVLLLELLWTETKTTWEQFKGEAAHLFGAKASVNHRRASAKMPKTHCLTVPKIQYGRSFSYLWKYLVFLKASGAVDSLVAKILVNHRSRYNKKMSKTFCLQEKFREAALLVFLKVSSIKKLSVTGVSQFFLSKFFVPHYRHFFINGTFWCWRVFICPGHKLHWHALK